MLLLLPKVLVPNGTYNIRKHSYPLKVTLDVYYIIIPYFRFLPIMLKAIGHLLKVFQKKLDMGPLVT